VTSGASTIIAVATVVATLASWPCAAQETRREVIAAERAARARTVTGYKPGRIERALLWGQNSPVAKRLFNRGDGFYPVFGSITRGAGPAFGAGWRHHVLSDRVLLNTSGAISTRGYRTGRVEVRLPRLAGGRVEIGSRARQRYFPQEDYFGIGPDSQKQDRTNYLLSETEFAGFGIYRPTAWFTAGGRVAHLSPDIHSGTDPNYPSIETRFDEQTAPGLAHQPNFLETGGLIEADFRDKPDNPKSGGRYSLLVAGYDDRDGARYDFTRATFVAEHHFPIFDKKRVFSVRAVATHLSTREGSEVPFYYMPVFGGRDTFRGFLESRFRDRTWALVNAEYRWEAVSGVEMALFYDVGEVKRAWRDLSLDDAHSAYGIGVRFGTASSIVVRTEVAFGSGEGTRAFIAFGAPLRVERYLR